MDPTLATLLTGMAAALMGYFLGLARHKRESNWQLKRDAYLELVLCLQQLRDYLRICIDSAENPRKYSQVFLEEQNRLFHGLMDKLDQSRALSYVLLGDEISNHLNKLTETFERRNDGPSAGASIRLEETDKVLALVQKRAKAELVV